MTDRKTALKKLAAQLTDAEKLEMVFAMENAPNSIRFGLGPGPDDPDNEDQDGRGWLEFWCNGRVDFFISDPGHADFTFVPEDAGLFSLIAAHLQSNAEHVRPVYGEAVPPEELSVALAKAFAGGKRKAPEAVTREAEPAAAIHANGNGNGSGPHQPQLDQNWMNR